MTAVTISPALAVPPLAGFTVGVTAARRAEELGTMLERRGASVVHGPALRIVPVADDTQLLAATRDLIARPPHITVATTGIGYRGWVEAADGWGLGEALLDALGSGTLLARGPKARGAIRASGLVDAWSPASESTAEVLDHLLAQDLTGRRRVLKTASTGITNCAQNSRIWTRSLTCGWGGALSVLRKPISLVRSALGRFWNSLADSAP